MILPIFGEYKKGKLHILKKVGLSAFKEILKKYVYNSTVMFFNILLFCLKGNPESLSSKCVSENYVQLSKNFEVKQLKIKTMLCIFG